MIDSSGRRALRGNGTVLDLIPIGQTVAIAGALLIVLFVLIKPEASHGLGTVGRIAFWTLHVGLGLLALAVSSHWLASRDYLPGSTLAAVLVTGCAAIAIAAPGYLILDAVFSAHVLDLDSESEATSLHTALVDEALEIAPWFMVVWLLINLPVLLPRPSLTPRSNDEVDHLPDDDPGSGPVSVTPGIATNAREFHSYEVVNKVRAVSEKPDLHLVDQQVPIDAPTPQVNSQGEHFLSNLPGIVGTDVIAVASDLHYLNVWTVAGRATVLGNLKDVVAELGEAGMQVHRSHWVAHAHVRRIVGTASNAACIMSNELRVPISRRRWKAVREQYGRGVVYSENASARHSINVNERR